ncbi:MAG TPA: hypothetical protein VFZ66_07100 [Herpetosiphonaceae bacterium]
MSQNQRAQQLHDKATRGELLTGDEQIELEQWYAQADQAEYAALGLHESADEAQDLQHPVNAALEQLQRVTQRIQEQSDENDAVRQEIAELQRRLARRSTSRAA